MWQTLKSETRKSWMQLAYSLQIWNFSTSAWLPGAARVRTGRADTGRAAVCRRPQIWWRQPHVQRLRSAIHKVEFYSLKICVNIFFELLYNYINSYYWTLFIKLLNARNDEYYTVCDRGRLSTLRLKDSQPNILLLVDGIQMYWTGSHNRRLQQKKDTLLVEKVFILKTRKSNSHQNNNEAQI